METSIFSPFGRIRRSSYWLRGLGCFGVMFAVGFLSAVAGVDREGADVLINITSVLFSIFMLMQGIKRMHDVGKSGWYLLVPIYGFVLLLSDGTVGANEYGADPKAKPAYS